jgi:putative MATE family efflux protein
MARPASLTEGPIARTLFVFTLPILAGNVLQSMNGSVNSIWIGHFLGEAALTASSNSNSILFFLIGAVFGVSIATTILIGQSMGKGDIVFAKRVVGTSATFFVSISVIVATIGFLISPRLLTAMHTPHDALSYATAYLRVIFVGVPFFFFYSFLMMGLRGAGDSRTPFYFLLLSVGMDIGLNPLLLFGWGPIPSMGIAGSATATVIGQFISLMALIVYLYVKKHPLRLQREELRYLKPDWVILKSLITKGIPMGLQLIVVSLSMVVTISLVNRFGSRTTAAYGASFQLWNYIQMPAFAVGQAVSSMVAQNVGAQKWDRVRRVALTGVGFNFLLTGSIVLLLYVFSGLALGLFLKDPETLRLAQHINAVVVWSFLFFGVGFVFFGVVRATGAVIPPLLMLFFSLWMVRLPFAYWMQARWGADAIWWSFPLSSLISMLLSIAYYRFGHWREARMLTGTPAPSPVAAEPAA